MEGKEPSLLGPQFPHPFTSDCANIVDQGSSVLGGVRGGGQTEARCYLRAGHFYPAIWQRCRLCPGEERKENEGTATHGRGGRGPNLGPGRGGARLPGIHMSALARYLSVPRSASSEPKRERERFRARCGRVAVHFACAKYGPPAKRAIARLCPRAGRDTRSKVDYLMPMILKM